ncbi:Mss4-like protein [Aspergillus heterothallicus]
MPTGSCLCQSVKYQYKGDALSKAVCHCRTCQKFSSGSSVNLLIPQDHFRITSGHPKEHNHTHETGMHMTMHFCPECGVMLYKTADREEFRGAVVLLAGTLDEPHALDAAVPEAEFFVGERAKWWRPVEGVQQLQGFT